MEPTKPIRGPYPEGYDEADRRNDVYEDEAFKLRKRLVAAEGDAVAVADAVYRTLEPVDFYLGYFLGADCLLDGADWERRGDGPEPKDIGDLGVQDARETIKAVLNVLDKYIAANRTIGIVQ